MNENSNVLSGLLVALNQLQELKGKIDPEAYVLLNKSAHEAIASAHHFLDACELAIDSLLANDEIDLTEEEAADVVDISKVNAR